MVLKSLILVIGAIALFIAGGIASNRPPLTEPPGFVDRMKRYLTTNVAETAEDSPFPELRPRRYAVSKDRLLQAVQEASGRLGWNVEASDGSRDTLRAVVQTALWRFRDDVEIRAEKDGECCARLYIRSGSRVGRADLGANTRHVLDLLAAVDALLASERDEAAE